MNLWVSWRVTPPATSGRMHGPVDIPLSCLERKEFTALTWQEGASRMARAHVDHSHRTDGYNQTPANVNG